MIRWHKTLTTVKLTTLHNALHLVSKKAFSAEVETTIGRHTLDMNKYDFLEMSE